MFFTYTPPQREKGGRLLRHPDFSGLVQEILVAIVYGIKVVAGVGVPAEGLTVADLLNVTQTAGHALVSIHGEGVQADGDPGVYTAVDLAAVDDRLHMAVNHLRRGLAVGVDEPAALVGVILALQIAVPQGQLQRGLVRDLPAELADALLDRAVDGAVDGIHGFGVALGDDQGAAVAGITAADGSLRVPDVRVGQTDDTGDDFGVILLRTPA